MAINESDFKAGLKAGTEASSPMSAYDTHKEAPAEAGISFSAPIGRTKKNPVRR